MLENEGIKTQKTLPKLYCLLSLIGNIFPANALEIGSKTDI